MTCGSRRVAEAGRYQPSGFRSDGFDQAELGQRGHTVVEAGLLHDLPVDHF